MDRVNNVECIDACSVHVDSGARCLGGILFVDEVEAIGGFGSGIGLSRYEGNNIVSPERKRWVEINLKKGAYEVSLE